VPQVFGYGRYHVYVYPERGAPHKSRHCHVRQGTSAKGKQVETVLLLPSLLRVAGPAIAADVMDYIREHVDEIVNAWERYNANEKNEKA